MDHDSWLTKPCFKMSHGEKKSSTPEASNKNDPWGKSENTFDKRKGNGGDSAWEKKSDDGHGNWEHPSNWKCQGQKEDRW